jgi:integrase/recombinase XerD
LSMQAASPAHKNKRKNKTRTLLAVIKDKMVTGNPVADRKIELALEGMPNHTKYQFLTEFPDDNKLVVADFLNDFVIRENVTYGTKRVYIHNLLYLSRHLKHKPFKLVTRDDILSYLQTLRRPLSADVKQKWINTHNNRLVIYLKFFKWLYFPDLAAKERPTPDVVKDLPLLKKKEKTHVQATDLWTTQDDEVFLKYCSDPRVALFHIMSLDTSARPHELLALKIGDVKIKQTEGGRIYGEAEVGRGGKTKSRTVPLIISLPYYKAWLERHPEPSNPNAFIFRSMQQAARYRNLPLKPSSVNALYWRLKHTEFPKLLERPDVTPEDKAVIRELLQKPWNPYIRRHISLTAKAKIVNEYTLRLHAGWSKSSKMVEVYTHELGGESSRALLEAAGILPKEGQASILQPKLCPHCSEPNKPGAKFCSRCKMVLSYDAYSETVEEKENKDKVIQSLQEQMASLQESHNEIRDLLKDPAKLLKILTNE